MTTLRGAAAFSALLAAAAAGAVAFAQTAPPERVATVQALADCRKLTEDSARLACYDKAVAALDQAEARGDIVVVDRDQARKVRRQAFGLSLPSLSLFDKGESDDEKGESDDELNNMTAQVASARQDGTGRWTVRLDSGATWTQVDTSPLRRTPKPGMPVTIRRAALGSFMMKIGDQHAVRAKRVE